MNPEVELTIFQTAMGAIEKAHIDSPFIVEGEENAQVEAQGAHPWIPFPCGKFVEMLLEVYTICAQRAIPGGEQKPKFLDIGCGIGTKVVLANVLFEAHGFDIIEKYIKVSRVLGCRRTFVQDAMAYEKYSDFDILYFYGPFKDEFLEKRFEKYLHQRMRPGQLLIPRHTMTMWDRLPDFEKLGEYVYLFTGEGR